jgi:pimeloyl-ACP methyl ester carboxylesterase
MVWREWGDGPPLVLLHGAFGSWTHWIRNVPALAREHRVLAGDMPGYGDSDAPPEPHTADGLAGLVVEAIDGVVPDGAPFHLAGFSFGGIIAGLVAARLGPRVRSLVLVGAGGLGLPEPAMPPLRRVDAGMSDAEVRAAHRENLAIAMVANPATIDDLAVTLQIDNVRRARFRSRGIPESDVLHRALPAITAPITAVWGDRDAFAAEPIDARRALLRAPHPAADVRTLAGGHWLPWEAADAVDRLVLDATRAAAARRR